MAGSDWDIKTVLERLRVEARASGSAVAQVFLHGDATGANLEKTAQALIDAAKINAEPHQGSATIGMFSPLSKSFLLTAPPEVFETLAKSSSVKSILPSSVDDILPKPTKIIPQ
jgi:hypothetical protein